MSKLSRKQRRAKANKEMINSRPQKTYSKRRYKCVFHDYEKQQDGTYVCLKCGYHFQEPMDDEKLYKYISSRNEYSLKELKEMTKFLKVIYGKEADGKKTVYKAKETTVTEVINLLNDFVEAFGCVIEDWKFKTNGIVNNKCTWRDLERFSDSDVEFFCYKPSASKLEALFSGKEWNPKDIDIYGVAKNKWSFIIDGQIWYFEVFPKHKILGGPFRDLGYPMIEHRIPKLAVRKVIFSKDGEVEKVVVRFRDGKILGLIN